jgi:hypothetical protein
MPPTTPPTRLPGGEKAPGEIGTPEGDGNAAATLPGPTTAPPPPGLEDMSMSDVGDSIVER